MGDKFEIQDRRHRDRVKMNYPATYTRYDKWGNPCDQKIAKVADVNLKGVRLQSSFRVEPGEILDVTLALGDNLVSFKGKTIHARLSEEHDYELGVSIEDIDDEQRATLIRFLAQIPNLAGN
jgi:hypothetical protein